ncbi:MAG: hypothetical protein B6U97_03590 [Candidatus Altiarchaeales archaeon ex4484_96]|nr:MAG: hypothetical protein B6U97_03590 [Candidatus Altiarchaeales archaeon ex4484_96]
MEYGKAAEKTAKAIYNMLPILLGVMMLISLFLNLIPIKLFTMLFTQNELTDPIIGALFGSVAIGNPLTSYIIGGELLNQGISLNAITAFIIAWVTVGVLQIPAESIYLGKKYAIYRNLLAFISSIIMALLTVASLGLVQ